MIEIIPNDKLKKVLISRASQKTGIPEDIVSKIIQFQFDDLSREMRETPSSTMNVYKFGKFILSRPRASARLDECQKIMDALEGHLATGMLDDKKTRNFEKKLYDTKAREVYISRKL